MTTHEINLLIERYLDGETTPAEERALALAVQREDRPAEWAIIAEMLGELTLDEAIYETSPNPSEGGENFSLSYTHSDSTTPLLRRRWGRSWGGLSWAAAACVVLAMGLSYNIINKPPQEAAKTNQPLPVQPKPENMPATKPLLVARPKPLVEKPLPQIEQPLIEEPPFEATVEEPLPALQPQLIAEVEEPTPPTEDLALYMALLAEVEARAFQTEQSEQQLYQALLDELLVNIQQQSNRPELSL